MGLSDHRVNPKRKGSHFMKVSMEKTTSSSDTAGRNITLIGALVNAVLISLKLLAGVFGKSNALIADGVHSISDLFTDVVVLMGIWRGRRPADEDHPFGHGRIETMSTALVGLSLMATALYLGSQAVMDIYFRHESHPNILAIIGAGVSIVIKEGLFRYTLRTGRRMKSQLVVANAWHHRSDALSSVAVLAGVTLAQIKPSWHIFDSFAALLVSFFIIKVGLEILGETYRELSDAAPDPETLDSIRQCALDVAGVMDAHDLRVRTSGGMHQIEIHIVVDAQLTVAKGHRIAKTVEDCMINDIDDVGRAIVHVDPSR
jgi:cation diffusion facilitator family transporter